MRNVFKGVGITLRSRDFWTLVVYTVPVAILTLVTLYLTKGDSVSFGIGIVYMSVLELTGNLARARNERRAAKKAAAERKPLEVDFSK